jgi:peptidoglycan hydrolase CwlO-like protein
MSISVELLATIISVIILSAGFILTRIKEAESRGRLLQRIDNLEKSLDDMHTKSRTHDGKLSVHDIELTKITSQLGNIMEVIEKMDKKIDQMLGRER